MQRCHQAVVLGNALAGEAEGRAVVRRGADEGQAERDIDAIVEAERLGGDQRLIVIHADRHVIASAGIVMEHRVGGQGAEGIDALVAQHFDRRTDDLVILLADRAVFAGMRIEAGNGEPRRGDAETRP